MTDDQINACRRSLTPPPIPCQGCPNLARCKELMAQEWDAVFGLEPDNGIEYVVITPGEWQQTGPPPVEYEVEG